MKISYLILTIILGVFLNIPLGLSQNSGSSSLVNEQFNTTEITISLRDLNQPYQLKLLGDIGNKYWYPWDISLNGQKLIYTFNKEVNLNLSPLLTVGKYTLDITGNHGNISGSIDLSLSGKNSQINQTISGTGIVKQRIIFNVTD